MTLLKTLYLSIIPDSRSKFPFDINISFHFDFIETLEARQGLKVGCIEEIALNKGYITTDELKILTQNMFKNEYSEYLINILIK